MTKEEIGLILKELRISCGMTQKEVAEKLGRTQQIVGHWETGYAQPDANTLFILCDIYGVTVDDAFGFKRNNNNISKEEYDHIKKYRFISEHSPEGASVVDTVLDREYSIVTQLTEKDKHIEELKLRPAEILEIYPRPNQFERLIEYHRSASAGDGVFILGNEASAKIAVSEADWNEDADFVINVSGNSMEPDYKDGDKVLVSHKIPIQHGDVGIFIVDGKVYIKEYGNKELISRNPNAENIKISEYANIVCMGKVVGKVSGEYKIIND